MAEKKNWMNDNIRNSADSEANLFHSGPAIYGIHVKGQLDSRWSEWLEGLEVRLLENGEMLLFGPIIDQAALMGVLNKLSHLNLTLLSVNRERSETRCRSTSRRFHRQPNRTESS
jgi:hypothetical protein